MGAIVGAVLAAFAALGLLVRALSGDTGGVSEAFAATQMQAQIEAQVHLYQTQLTGCVLRMGAESPSSDGQPRGWPTPIGGLAVATSLTCRDGRSILPLGQPAPAAPSGFSNWVYRRDAAAVCLSASPSARTSDTDNAVRAVAARLGSAQAFITRDGGLAVLLTKRAATIPAGSLCDL
jgi:hypothetical protein